MNVFNTTFTKQEPFYDTNGAQIGNVNMMFQRGPLAYAAIADIGCHVLELPYAEAQVPTASRGDIYGSGLSMIIILPRKGLSLSDAMAKVYSFTMNKIYRELYNSKFEYDDEEVEIHLPRFEIATSVDVKETLEIVSEEMFVYCKILKKKSINLDGNQRRFRSIKSRFVEHQQQLLCVIDDSQDEDFSRRKGNDRICRNDKHFCKQGNATQIPRQQTFLVLHRR